MADDLGDFYNQVLYKGVETRVMIANDKEDGDLTPISDEIEPEKRIPGVYRVYFETQKHLFHFTQANIILMSDIHKGFTDSFDLVCVVIDFNGREELLKQIQA
eukprot:748387_1